MKRGKTIEQALQFIADHPQPSAEMPVDVPVWEHVARNLFELANDSSTERGALARATKAQKMIFDRLVGRRRPGTHPAQASTEGVTFVDLTQGVLE